MITRWKTAILAASLSVNVVGAALALRSAFVREARADVTASGEDLLPYMSTQQRNMHKLGLSIRAANKPLAEFYLKEIGETFQVIQTRFPTYENIQVGALSKAMIDPATPALEKALAASNWSAASTAYTNLVTACNNCHAAAQHPFVKIVAPSGNPFNQSFSP